MPNAPMADGIIGAAGDGAEARQHGQSSSDRSRPDHFASTDGVETRKECGECWVAALKFRELRNLGEFGRPLFHQARGHRPDRQFPILPTISLSSPSDSRKLHAANLPHVGCARRSLTTGRQERFQPFAQIWRRRPSPRRQRALVLNSRRPKSWGLSPSIAWQFEEFVGWRALAGHGIFGTILRGAHWQAVPRVRQWKT